MSRRDAERLADIVAALDAIEEYLPRGALTDGLVFDAVRMRLIEIGEAVKGLPKSLLDLETSVQWHDVAAMRDFLAHRYFDTAHAVLTATVEHDLEPLRSAVGRLRDRVDDERTG